MFDITVTDGVLQLHRPHSRWLSSGWDGGFVQADAAYNISVPADWDNTNLRAYTTKRLRSSSFSSDGPTLLTGVSLEHARCATLDSVIVVATAGLSNPTMLPVNSTENTRALRSDSHHDDSEPERGTINLLVGIKQSLDDRSLIEVLTAVVEAKTATVYAVTGFTGTTTDATIIGSDAGAPSQYYSGGATALGKKTRACVRDAVLASLQARYDHESIPKSVEDAQYGTTITQQTTVFSPHN